MRQTSASRAFSVCSNVGDADGLGRDSGKSAGYPDDLTSPFTGSAINLDVLWLGLLHGCGAVSAGW